MSAPHCCCSWGGCDPSEDADGTLAHLCLPESLVPPFQSSSAIEGSLEDEARRDDFEVSEEVEEQACDARDVWMLLSPYLPSWRKTYLG